MLINIKKILSNKRDYLDLLLLADPSEETINKYLDKSEMFVLSVNGIAVSEVVITKLTETTCEIKNLATAIEYQRQGFAKQLLQHIFQNYKTEFTTMLVGTTNSLFFEKFGFQYSHTVDNYFTKNYPKQIAQSIKYNDLMYLKKDLHIRAKAITRSEESILSLIIDTAKKDDRIRIVAMNGSRVNPKAPKDFFQDYDIAFIVSDYEAFTSDPNWINIFGRRLIMQTPSLMTGSKKDDKRFSYLMQFIDGNRIDLTIIPYEERENYIKEDSLIKILLDKDKALPVLASPSDQSHWIKKPTQKEFHDACNEFWWVSVYVAKGLWRKEFLYATSHIESCIRKELLKILRWRIGIENNFEVSTGNGDKYMENYLSKENFERLMRTYNLSDYDKCWDSLFTMIELFRKNATFVSEKLGFNYNSDDDKNVYAFLRHICSLPGNAKALYDENS